MPTIRRCDWAATEPEASYHDTQWGVPVHDDRLLLEMLILEGAQAGLSWRTILLKRENYRRLYDGFDPRKIARYDQPKVAALLSDPGIVRNRLKVAASIANAQAVLRVIDEFGSFDAYLWPFVGGQPRIRRPRSTADIPPRSPESDALSRDLARRGFRFVGSTIVYAFMQAVGMVNDHTIDCFRFPQLAGRR